MSAYSLELTGLLQLSRETRKQEAMDLQSPTLSIKSQESSSMDGNKQAEEKQGQETTDDCCDAPSLLQKVLAETVTTYVMVFSGCGSVMVNQSSGGQLGLVGVAATWGLVVMAMIYATSHISGTHMNPAVTLAFATCHGFPWCQVPWYVGAQFLGSIGAAFTLRLVFHDESLIEHMVTRPQNGYLQSFVLEVIITSTLLLVVSGVGTDTLSVGSMAGLVIGATVAMNVFIAGPVSGASMNPIRSLGPAIVANIYKDLYVYMLGPSVGAIIGCLVYNNIRSKKQGEKGHQGKLFVKFKLLKRFSNMLKGIRSR
ncbi:hypothetical protein GOP47_0020952 [Adiantum capillus-veneris]|uniref:Uncharacterized protein n=1 Tax=Adiantum capillus-veneris TaxID=13818 RepID=A0A9D4Z877_ADICA|nr:hypothetical protein GOP47_0020952 [Adiantum capillus-veneris]